MNPKANETIKKVIGSLRESKIKGLIGIKPPAHPPIRAPIIAVEIPIYINNVKKFFSCAYLFAIK